MKNRRQALTGGSRWRKVKRWAIYSRQAGADGYPWCLYCGAHGPGVPMSIDHADPAGGDGFDNLAACCLGCNMRKGSCSASPSVREWLAARPVTLQDGRNFIDRHPDIVERVSADSDLSRNGLLWELHPGLRRF